MYLDFTPEQEGLRAQIREYYQRLFTPELRAAMDAEWHECGGPVFRKVVGSMGRDGWLGIGWPREYGGQGRGQVEQLIFYDEAWRARAPVTALTINTVARTLMEFGTHFPCPDKSGWEHNVNILKN